MKLLYLKMSYIRCTVRFGRWPQDLLAVAVVLAMLSGSMITALAQAEMPAGEAATVAPDHSLQMAMREMADGHFEQAREHMAGFSDQQGNYFRLANNLLGSYENLRQMVSEAYDESYREYLEGMNEAVAHARWRQDTLAGSQTNTLDSDQKSEFETQFADKIDSHWLKALSQMALARSLAKRVGLENTLDDDAKDLITTKCLAIAEKYEAENKWLDAYSRIYSYLTVLDEKNEAYEEHARRLIRQASLVDMYVPDPNQESVSWQERREGITFSMINRGVQQLHYSYVEKPDYQDMILKGLDYCRYLGSTVKLAETFENLSDEQAVKSYLDGIEELTVQAKSKDATQINHTQVLEFLRYVQRVNESSLKFPLEVILAEYAQGAFSALDGYTYLIWPADVEEFQKDMTNEFFGVGIEIGQPHGLLEVTSLLNGHPAMEAGLDAGDVILAIDGKSTSNITMEMAVKRITGPKGTDVVLTIDRQGFDEPRDFTITRDRIIVQTVRGLYRGQQGQWQYFVDKEQGIGYVQIKSFSSSKTSSDFSRAVRHLEQQGLRGLIVDLRRNSGGFLSAAVEVVDFFVANGPIVSTRASDPLGGNVDYAKAAGTFNPEIPVIVLVDSMSASASEIVSGALKDHQRALIVGSRTFGKGNVQTVQKLLPTAAELKMTIAYYYLPSNRRVHRDPKDKDNEDYGVEPDITIELTSKQLLGQYEVHRNASILHQNTDADENDDRKVYGADELLDSDLVLQMAVLCMKADLAAKELGHAQPFELVRH